MTRTKKIAAALAGAALAACAALCLAGCGEDVAASWAHGKVLEADVTAAAESELENYRNDDGSYDISSWTNYIANREYDENATEEEQKANEEAADGTVADYRDYLAKKELREQIVSYEVEKRNIEVTDEEVEEILGKLDSLMDWASDIKDYELQAAISGKHWCGYKLVEGRANRRYTDENAVVAAVKAAGYDPYDEPKLLGVTAMTTLLGRKQFNDILGGLITKPQGKPTLVSESDKRPAMTTILDDFKEEN